MHVNPSYHISHACMHMWRVNYVFPDIQSIIQEHIPQAFPSKKGHVDTHFMLSVPGVQTY